MENNEFLDKSKVCADLERLKSLPANWDGYGAQPLNREILDSAIRWIERLPAQLISTPQVVPMTRGRVQLEWHKGSRSLELEFESADTIHYLKWDSAAGVEEEDIMPAIDWERLLGLLTWFASEQHDAIRTTRSAR